MHPGSHQVVVLTNEVLPATGSRQNWVLVGARSLAFKGAFFQVLHSAILRHALV